VVDERADGDGDEQVAASGPHREVAAGEAREGRRPRSCGVHDRIGAERALRGPHRAHASVTVVREPEHLAVPADLRPEAARVGEQRGRGEHRLDLRVVGVVRAERQVGREVRLERAQPVAVEQLGGEPDVPVAADEVGERCAARVVGGDDDAALRLVLEALAELRGVVGPAPHARAGEVELGARRLVGDEDVALTGRGRAGGEPPAVEHQHAPSGERELVGA